MSDLQLEVDALRERCASLEQVASMSSAADHEHAQQAQQRELQFQHELQLRDAEIARLQGELQTALEATAQLQQQVPPPPQVRRLSLCSTPSLLPSRSLTLISHHEPTPQLPPPITQEVPSQVSIDDLVSLRSELEAKDHEFSELLACLGQEGEKVRRLQSMLTERGVDVEAILEAVEAEFGFDEE